MADNLYLILHKVRGEPAFDIATPIQIGSEEGWIIPTSGHRAYPYRMWQLEDLSDISDINHAGYHDRPYDLAEADLPEDLPDHYRGEIHKLNIKAKVYRTLEKNDPSDAEMLEVLDLLREYSK